MIQPPRSTATARKALLVAAVVLLAAPAVYATVSFSGQGTAIFDAIRVGKNVAASLIYLQGPVSNPGTKDGKPLPLTINDSLVVNSTLRAKTNFAAYQTSTLGINDSNSLIYLQGPVSNPGTKDGKALPVTINDSLRAEGNASVIGALTVVGNTTLKGDLFKRLPDGTNYNMQWLDLDAAYLANSLAIFALCLGFSAGPDITLADHHACWDLYMAEASFINFDGSLEPFGSFGALVQTNERTSLQSTETKNLPISPPLISSLRPR